MGTASNETKQRWNTAHYTQVKVSVPPDIAAAFKERCMADGVSMAGEISRFMSGQNRQAPKVSADPYDTRRKRRKALSALAGQLEAIHDAEQQYLDNIPENLRNSRTYEAAEQTVAGLEEALNILSEAY